MNDEGNNLIAELNNLMDNKEKPWKTLIFDPPSSTQTKTQTTVWNLHI